MNKLDCGSDSVVCLSVCLFDGRLAFKLAGGGAVRRGEEFVDKRERGRGIEMVSKTSPKARPIEL